MPFVRDEKSLERVAGEMAFSRGESYYRSGAVKTIARKDNYLEGFVQGSEPQPFHVRIIIKGMDNLRSAECSCPFKLGSMCKHAVAVLLHWIHYVAITAEIDVSKLIFLDEKQLKINTQMAPLPQKILPQAEKPVVIKKIKRSDYVLPEYQHRSPQRPRIQIVLSVNGFIGKVTRSIPFKVFIIKGEEKFAVLNFKSLLNEARARNADFPSFSMFSSRQQYVLNFLNEHLMIDSSASGFAQPQFRIKRMQWAVCLASMADCPGVEFVDSKTNQRIEIDTVQKLSLTLNIRLIEKGLWGVKASLKDPQNQERDFNAVHIQEGHPVWIFDEGHLSFQVMDESITYPFLNDFLNTERILDAVQIPYFISAVLAPLRKSCAIIEERDCLKNASFLTPSLSCRLDLNYIKDSVRAKLCFVYEGQETYPYEGNVCIERFAHIPGLDELSWVVRDIEQENAKAQCLLRDCSFEWRKNSKVFVLSGTEDILGFVYQKLPMLRREMDVHCSKDFELKLLSNKFFEPVVRLTGNGIDWFEFDAVYKVEGIEEEITHARIKKLVLEGQHHIRLKKG